MSAAIPVAAMRPGTGELSAATDAHALLIAAENVPGGYSTYQAIADHLNRIGYRAVVARGGAWKADTTNRKELS